MTNYETRDRKPSPSRLIEALRDTGYSFETAIADLIDNSIAALATDIHIQAYRENSGEPVIYLLDNGIGMNAVELDDAMAYGSSERDEKRSLGKFGMGLKTASTSQARKLTVITKREGVVQSATWDIDHVVREDKWELIWGSSEEKEFGEMISELPNNNLKLIPISSENDAHCCPHCEFGNMTKSSYEEVTDHINEKHIVNDDSGTAVLWQNIDRIIKKYKDPNSEDAEKAWNKIMVRLKDHLMMVYDRYLDQNNTNVRTVKIMLNDEKLKGWDPFCKALSDKTAMIKRDRMLVIDANGNEVAPFTITAYAIPSKSELSKEEMVLTKMNKANNWQGIYVYREDRLLVAADWFRLRAREAHANKLRIELKFDYRLDEDFQLDFKKTRIIFNPAIRAQLRDNWLPLVVREAERMYRERSDGSDNSGHADSDNIISGVKPGILVEKTENTIEGEESEVSVTNAQGRHTVKIQVSNSEQGNYIQPIDGLKGNMVYQPVLIDGHPGVQINTNHDFYKRVYLPNKKIRGVTLGLDGLFWSLTVAELKAIPASENAIWFSDMRWELTRILEKYANELPEYNADEENN